MPLQDIIREAQTLSDEECRQLIKILINKLGSTETSYVTEPLREMRSLLELAGLGAEIWQGIDAQEYVEQLRREWDDG